MKIAPWRRRESLQPFHTQMEDFWDRFFGNGETGIASRLPEVFRERAVPPLNVAEAEGEYTITMDCPGLEIEDIDVEVMGHQLVVSFERKWEEKAEDKEFRRVESQYGKFQRTVPLPENARVDTEAIEASYKKGVLELKVPKSERTPAARITVQAE